jgi:hypothetical protein
MVLHIYVNILCTLLVVDLSCRPHPNLNNQHFEDRNSSKPGAHKCSTKKIQVPSQVLGGHIGDTKQVLY